MLKNILNDVDSSERPLEATNIAEDLGSPSQKVVVNAHCPTLLVR